MRLRLAPFLALLLGACAGSSAKAPGSSVNAERGDVSSDETEPAPDAGMATGDEEADVDSAAAPEDAPDPALDALLASYGIPGKPNPRANLGIRFAVAEGGPQRPWLLVIANDGEQPVQVAADPRLLRFTLEVPGKRKAITCKLPDGLFPTREDPRLAVVLEPGEAVAHAFDPRLYCFTASGQTQLVPGAIVTPVFGFPPAPAPRRKKAQPAAPEPPFVAERLREQTVESDADAGTTSDARARAASDASAPAPVADDAGERLKELQAEPFALRSEYARWTSPAAEYAQQNPEAPLNLVMVQGSDAEAERTASVQLSLRNTSKTPQRVYFRRELVTFEVMTPDGVVSCDSQPDSRAPDPQAFSTLKAGGSMTVSSRLVELCPAGVFARPGLYLVHARLDARETGHRWGMDAFTGTVASSEPVAVRIRTGELPFLQKRQLRKIKLNETN